MHIQVVKLPLLNVRKDFLDGSNMYGMEDIYNRFVEEKIWIFGMNPEEWPYFLREYGYKIIEDIGAEDIEEKYLKPTEEV